jgi:hypothetical protein
MGAYRKRLIGRLFNFLNNKKKSWKEIEYFNPQWKERIIRMHEHIKDANSIVDYGCGEMWLKEFLGENVKYIGVDYTQRQEHTVICDFNKSEFPSIKTDAAFISGCLEYIEDYEWFIKNVCAYHNKCVISYCILDKFPDSEFRKARTWVNHLTEEDLISLFNKNSFKLIKKEYASNPIYLLERMN